MTEAGVAVPQRRVPSFVWILVAGSAVTAVSLGIRSTFGLFLTPVTAALQTDRAGFALAIAIQNLVWGFGQPVAGAIADRFGAPRVLATGGVLYTAGVFGMSRATNVTGFYLTGGLVVGLAMAAASFAVVLAAVGRIAPPERRTSAMGMVTAAGSIGQFLLVPTAGRLEDAMGWRSALATLGAVALVVIAMAPVLREARRADGTAAPAAPFRPALQRALRHPSYLLLCAGFFVCGFHVTFIGTHLPAYLGDVGLTKGTGARAVALIGLFNIAGSLAAGRLAGRFAKNRLLSIVYGARAVAIVGLVLLPHTPAVALAFGAVMGLLWLSTVPLTSGIVVGQFGVANAGSLFGVVFLAHQIGAFVGVWYGGWLADATGSYVSVWWLAVALGVFAAVINLFVSDAPAPPAPERAVASSGLGAGAGVASVLVLATVSAYGAAGVRAEQDETSVPAPYCVIHPTS